MSNGAPDNPRPKRAAIREMIMVGWSNEAILARIHVKWRSEIAARLREIRDSVARDYNKKVRRNGPFPISYTRRDGVNVYDVGGGHAVHGEYGLKAMGFEDGSSDIFLRPALGSGEEA